MTKQQICSMFEKETLKRQCKISYLLIPMIVYFLMQFQYSKVELYLFGRDQVVCLQQNQLVLFDKSMFQGLYDGLNQSAIIPLLIVFSLPYLLHFIAPVIYILYIIFRCCSWHKFWVYVLALGLTSLASSIIQACYPTSPPWLYLNLPPEAKFYLVDNTLHLGIFRLIYGSNPMICGAFPSLHTAWPTVMAASGELNVAIGIFYVVWIITAAVYAGHHWIIDTVFGIIIALVMTFSARKIIDRLIEQPKTNQVAPAQQNDHYDQIHIQNAIEVKQTKDDLADINCIHI